MLVLDALAPAAGAAASLVLSVPPQALGLLLAFFAGMLLYVGGAGVLPRAWAPGAAGSGRGFVEPAVLLALGAMSAGAVRFVAI
jgi:zinc transporter ZupT